MDFFTGEDILEFLRELLIDIQNLSDADIISVLFRITLVVIGIAVLTAFTKFLYGILQDTLKKPVNLILIFLTAPYRVPASVFRSWRRNKRFNQEQKLREEQNRLLQIEEEQNLERQKQYEKSAFDEIMKK